MIRFGPMSIVLMLGAAYGLLVAVLLWWAPRNRGANRCLALLLVVIALQMLPYIIGYAGFYDAFPWLSYLPYEASLAIGPLLYLHGRLLAQPVMPPRWGWHFAPVAVQVAYYAVIFPLPLAFKNQWNQQVHVPWLVPLEQAATVLSIGGYGALSILRYRAYQAWLADNVSDREDHHVEWLRNFLIALGITWLLWAGLAAFQRWVQPLDYFEEFPLYLWLAVLSYYLGTEGYRHAGHRYPVWPGAWPPVAEPPPPAEPAAHAAPTAPAAPTTPTAPAEAATPPGKDWAALGAAWREQVRTQRWWRDADLTLAALARRLGTNTSDLSRAFNDGLGQNFNELVNRMRVDAVKAALAAGGGEDGRTLLDIALDAGFSSKASFNRSFKLYTGQTPSDYAAQARRLEY
ncbi:MAG: AraC family transcriptional regulator [Burkholderiaceae bacterium]